ncbi:glycosyltransferase family 4 protein [Conexibacter sp. DBS9H8]|uniref:glycosyltransferase family 4 protein n=1 Tax=Conexibacter sp. DBS9H8 TaxID=2937801 RepID=UPI00201032E7|nr:glycosyltransferase family 4 protein [Conexibacter sp. DBS9H8]
MADPTRGRGPRPRGAAVGPTTVLYLHSSTGRYGADRQLALILAGLDRDHYRPIVVLPDATGPLVGDLTRAGVEVIVMPLAVVRRGATTPTGLARLSVRAAADAAALARLIRSRRVALVHSNTSVLLGGAAAAALTGVPHVWHIREIYARWDRLWPYYRRLLASAAALPCVSVAASVPFGGSERVTVIHDGLAVAPRRTQRGIARARLALPQDRPLAAVVGRVSDWKGQDQLILALATAELTERGVHGLIAGDAWPGAEERLASVHRLAADLGVSDRVHFRGFVEPVADVYGAADVIAVPSTAPDPLPGAAVEAAAAGAAVVAAAHGGLPEIITDAVTGRLVPPGDPDALAHAVAGLIDEPRRRATLGAAASRDVRRRFAPARMHAAVAALYGELT